MCGIVGFVGQKQAAPVVLEGLDDQTAAAVMAIVSKESGVPLSRLSFNSIKKVD